MRKKKNRNKHSKGQAAPAATFYGPVLQSIRQHARQSPDAEICGVLIGRQGDDGTIVTGAVAGEGAAQGGAHVTFTQEAWVKIHEEKDRKYSGQAIVGWYHSHPGFGVFLSDQDLFIHKNFFSSPGSLAWVYDPHSDEEGCFGWNGGDVRRCERYGVVSEVSRAAPKNAEHAHFASSPAPKQENTLNLGFLGSHRGLNTMIIVASAILLALLLGLGLQILLRSPQFEHLIPVWLKEGGKPAIVNCTQRSSESIAFGGAVTLVREAPANSRIGYV